jgi:long-chain acyl-CoA synthetase
LRISPSKCGWVSIGHNVMKGYWSLPEATADAVVSEWFPTGDIGRVDEEGYFYTVARKKI